MEEARMARFLLALLAGFPLYQRIELTDLESNSTAEDV